MQSQKPKPSLQIRLTVYIGGILLFSNTLLLLLLFYNFGTALAGFEIPVNGEMVQYHFNDHLEERLLLLGVLIATLTTVAGTALTYVILGRVLEPLRALSIHMQKADQENIMMETNLTSNNREVSSLIASFDSMSRKLHRDFLTQKNFSSFVAHELRTPLAVMRAKIDIYQKKPENPDELIGFLSKELTKVSSLVTEILDLSGIKRIKLTEQVPLALLLEEVTEDLESYAEEAGVILSKEPESIQDLTDPRFEVIGNHNLLYRAFFNLVQNGIKYNNRGGEVRIHLKTVGNIIRVEISDDGFGIPEACRAQIFDPFYRTNEAKVQKKQGHGVGLAFAKEVIIHHKGSLKLVDSKQGSTFQVLLLQSSRRDRWEDTKTASLKDVASNTTEK